MPEPVKILPVIPCAVQGRWSRFWECLFNLRVPPGVALLTPKPVVGCSAAANRNLGVKFGKEVGVDWFFFLDDDLVFHPDVLCWLWKDIPDDADAVVGLSLKRNVPFPPLLFDRQEENGSAYHMELRRGLKGLIPIKASTSGGLLVKRGVFDAMEGPWWTLGQIEKDGWGDDLDFCRRFNEAGLKLYANLGVPFGHIIDCVVWPVQLPDGTWTTQFATEQPFASGPQAGDPAWGAESTQKDRIQEARAFEIPGPKKGRLKGWNS